MKMNDIFGRYDHEGNVGVFYREDGEAVQKFDSDMPTCYPLNADKGGLHDEVHTLSAHWEVAQGIILSEDEALKIGLLIE